MAATYYLSPDGDDETRGSRANPWQSIERANEAVQPGDTVVLMPGEYRGTIEPERSGRSEAPITFRAAERREARLVPDQSHAIILDDREHIVIDGLYIDGQHDGGWFRMDGAQHITIRDCHMVNSAPANLIEVSQHVRLLDNIFRKNTVDGNMVQFQHCEYVLIEGNSFSHVGHSPLQISGRNVVVRANVFRNDWGRNYEFWATERILVEGNVITENRDSARSADSRAKNVYYEGIFRFNRVFGNRHTPLNSPSYISVHADATHRRREPYRFVNSRVYHNTFAHNLGFAWQTMGMNISANIFQNNIFYRNDWAGGNVQFARDTRRDENPTSDNRLVSNLFRGTEPGQTVIRWEGEHWTLEEAEDNTRLWRGYWSEVQDNIDADPAFRDPDTFDYRLSSASEAIGAGRPLALTMLEGEGDVLTVTDGVPFYDGFGIEGEKGDWIMIGEGDDRQLARVERVVIRRDLPSRLYLDREVRWTDGMAVSLPWSGEAPDLGAYEHELADPHRIVAVASPAQPGPGDPVDFELETVSGATLRSVEWDFEDGGRSTGEAPRYVFEEPGNYGVTVRAMFEDGTRAADAVFIKVREPDVVSGPLVEADFADETRESHWGFQFKFYRGWLTGYERVEREDGKGKKMRLFYADKRNEAAGALAPGAWTIEDYPYIRFSYRIKPGTPVAICVEPFEAPDRPDGFILGGTDNRATGDYIDLDQYELIADGQWHEITVDLRHIHDEMPELEHLYRFMFYTQWDEDEGQEFWFDDFVILPAEER